MTKSVAFFNNKGGVGKTTLICNIGAVLAQEYGKRVLIVDADPQCNATQYILQEKLVNSVYANPDKAFTINSVVHPLAVGRGYSGRFSPTEGGEYGVDLILGDPRLAIAEDLLSGDWKDATSGSTRGLRTTFLFSDLISRCGNYDFVLFDMGPSLGAINRSVLLAVDFFLVPMSIDIFSLRAIENITQVLDKWRRQLRVGLELNENPGDLSFIRRPESLKFCGYITQQYKAKKDKHGKVQPVAAYERIRAQIPDIIEANFISKLQPEHSEVNYELGSVENLSSLIPMSQQQRRPIFAISAQGTHNSKARKTKKVFAAMADRLMENIEELQ
ncbi:AAA family ATPase [Myxococcus llanfairpwllgwyngyllgogerychwyrndrobwllllantysiliogogogochensis]|uniref:AAA family ATPase n=2 Tax=Myxococcus llanfairpwllgwyngyllgogerychwyrndrobwllllantysiliogogogochensis TaxID=2590453 RepID=A0A540X6Y0_9BACT|nr:AAA family ATPase [Myxococcus llanfairpwllgwyngyllgogerychwyrndrobwllllantysiliogogogochensis]